MKELFPAINKLVLVDHIIHYIHCFIQINIVLQMFHPLVETFCFPGIIGIFFQIFLKCLNIELLTKLTGGLNTFYILADQLLLLFIFAKLQIVLFIILFRQPFRNVLFLCNSCRFHPPLVLESGETRCAVPRATPARGPSASWRHLRPIR